jgi:hypothetical protein
MLLKLPSFSIGMDWKELRRFESLNETECSIVFYAENKASMNHFRLLILELTEKMNLQICYVTSIKDDPIFLTKNQNIKSFYIGDGSARTKFFLTLKSKIMIMDMPDLNMFHIKRSMTFPVHYVYLFHSMFSIHSYLRKGAIDNYDTIFCVGEHHINEIRETEKVYGLNPKKLIKYGYGRLDTLIHEKKNYSKNHSDIKNLILITPSYGDENLLKICGIELIDILLKSNFKVLLRPHFRTLRDSKKLMNDIKERFEKNPNFILETGVIPSNLFHNALGMISDWSGISLEYAFTFERPVIFIDVPKKNVNLNVKDIMLDPIEISIRNKIGHVVLPKNLEKIPSIFNNLEKNTENFYEQIKKISSKTVYNIGNSAKIGAKYIQELNDSP